MKRFKSPLPLWLGYPLLFVLGVATGIIATGYEQSRTGNLSVPAEIVISPPPPGVLACFPDLSFFSASRFQHKLLDTNNQPDSCQLRACIEQWNRQDERSQLHLLSNRGSQYSILAYSNLTFRRTGDLTLITDQGLFLLFPIPKRLHAKYDSLLAARY